MAGCGFLQSDDSESGTSAGHRQPVTVLISGDTSGWLVPCGCTSNQSGGLLRRATLVEQRRARGPVVVLDVGGAPAGTSRYDTLRFEAIVQGEQHMGVTAHNLGSAELNLPGDELKRITGSRPMTWLSANVESLDGSSPGSSLTIAEAGGQKMAIVGVVGRKFVPLDRYRFIEPREAVLNAIETSSRSYDWLIVLAYLEEPELRTLAAELPEAHLVIGGPTGQCIAPEQIGATWLGSATNHGKFLLEFTLPAERGAAVTQTNVIEMSEQFTDDSDQSRNLDEFRALMGQLDLPASDTRWWQPASAAAAALQYVGSKACRDCHAEACDVWTASAHHHAWETLQDESAHVDPECQRCHTTGYGQPGGFLSALQSLDRTSVGCESCHGPSSRHIAEPKSHPPFHAADQCVTCHDHENSPHFAYDKYWSLIAH